MVDFFVYVLIFSLGITLGFLVKSWLTGRLGNYSGTILVDKDELTEKTVYTLVLDEYPEELKFRKTVIFRVDAPKRDRE